MPRYPVTVFLLAQLAVHKEFHGGGLGKVALSKAGVGVGYDSVQWVETKTFGPALRINDEASAIQLLAIGFCWAHKTGEWLHEQVKPLTVKTMGGWRKACFAMIWIF